MQLHVTTVERTRHLRPATGVDALTKADDTVLLALKLHRLSVEGANVCHRSPSDGDNRSSTVRRMQRHCRLKIGSTWDKPHAGTHDSCTRGAASVETMSPAVPTHSVCDLTQRDVCDLPQRDVCDLKQRDRCDL